MADGLSRPLNLNGDAIRHHPESGASRERRGHQNCATHAMLAAPFNKRPSTNMTKRKTITTTKRLRIWAAHNGVCHLCKLSIHAERGERWHVEHIVPIWNGGADDENNMAPAHIDCHAPKTKEEAKKRAKGNRQRAQYICAMPEPKQKLKGRGFQKKPRTPKPSLPPRPMYEDIK